MLIRLTHRMKGGHDVLQPRRLLLGTLATLLSLACLTSLCHFYLYRRQLFTPSWDRNNIGKKTGPRFSFWTQRSVTIHQRYRYCSWINYSDHKWELNCQLWCCPPWIPGHYGQPGNQTHSPDSGTSVSDTYYEIPCHNVESILVLARLWEYGPSDKQVLVLAGPLVPHL